MPLFSPLYASDLLQLCLPKLKPIKSDQPFDQEGEFISFSKDFSGRLRAVHIQPQADWWAVVGNKAMCALGGQ